MKWRGKSVLLTAPTSLHYTDCTPGNWPGREESITTVQTDGKSAIQGEVRERQSEGNLETGAHIKACGGIRGVERQKEVEGEREWESRGI